MMQQVKTGPVTAQSVQPGLKSGDDVMKPSVEVVASGAEMAGCMRTAMRPTKKGFMKMTDRGEIKMRSFAFPVGCVGVKEKIVEKQELQEAL